jgi:hypothetical protein
MSEEQSYSLYFANPPSRISNEGGGASFVPDSIVQSVVDAFIQRAKFGKEKYGTTLDREDLTVDEWIQHAKEEHMDAILYLEKLQKTLRSQK